MPLVKAGGIFLLGAWQSLIRRSNAPGDHCAALEIKSILKEGGKFG